MARKGQGEMAAQHVAIIMDGNGRWARARGLPHIAGHKQGVEALRRTINAAQTLGIRYLTVYGFSSENWSRPPDEVMALMGLLRLYLRREIAELHSNGIRMRVIGDRARLPDDIVELIESAESLTAGNDNGHLTIALSYGARQELTQAAKRLAQAAKDGRIDPSTIDEVDITRALFTADLPDPDLIIRTSGEQRISNFLLWQSAYAELVFLDTLWPDFGQAQLEQALMEFNRRERRFGARVEQG